jgi:hypothetical protein
LLNPIPNAQEEEFRRICVADFYLRGSTLPVGMVLRLIVGQLNELWGDGPCPVAVTLHARARALYREW